MINNMLTYRVKGLVMKNIIIYTDKKSSEIADTLSSIEDINIRLENASNLKDYEIAVLLHELNKYFEYGNEDDNIVTCIKFSRIDDKLFKTYNKIFDWFSRVLAKYPDGFIAHPMNFFFIK